MIQNSSSFFFLAIDTSTIYKHTQKCIYVSKEIKKQNLPNLVSKMNAHGFAKMLYSKCQSKMFGRKKANTHANLTSAKMEAPEGFSIIIFSMLLVRHRIRTQETTTND